MILKAFADHDAVPSNRRDVKLDKDQQKPCDQSEQGKQL